VGTPRDLTNSRKYLDLGQQCALHLADEITLQVAAECDKLPNGSSSPKCEPISESLVRRSYPTPHQQRRDVMKALLSVLTAAFIAVAAGAPAAAQSTLTVAEDDIACPDKAFVASAMKNPLDWARLSSGDYFIPFARQFDLYRTNLPGTPDDQRCRYLGDLLGAEYDRDDPSLAFVSPVHARVDVREGDLVCLQRPDRPPAAKCFWASARPPSQRVRGPRPQ
jgi:hypothetical protein